MRTKFDDGIKVGSKGNRLRQAEKAIALCRRAWKVVHRTHPNEFDDKVPNPWVGVTLDRRIKRKKPAVTKEQVYRFAHGCIEAGYPEAAAAAVVCFEWLQRPENVLKGYLRWSDYRSAEAPDAIRIEHHKTGEHIWHPLEETVENEVVKYAEEAEAVLSHLPKRGIPMILREVKKGVFKPYSFSGMHKIVHKMRDKLGTPLNLHPRRLSARRDDRMGGGWFTDGQGRALSGHEAEQARGLFEKARSSAQLLKTETPPQHPQANAPGTAIQNETSNFGSEWTDGRKPSGNY